MTLEDRVRLLELRLDYMLDYYNEPNYALWLARREFEREKEKAPTPVKESRPAESYYFDDCYSGN